jgi:tetratricopeptide (TPR) repeat protein
MKNLRALNLKTVILRKLLKKEQAKNLAEMISDENPLDLQSRNELYLLDASSDRSSLTELNTIMHGEVETYLELATFYGNCAAWQEAIDVLSRLDVTEHDKGSDYPMLYYYLGYYYAQMGEGQKSMLYYQQASQMPNEYVFPYRMESLDVLRHAIERNPQDAHAHYYIGNQLFDHQPRKAMQHWEKSRDIDDSFYIVHRNLGIAYENVETDYNKAILSYEKALDLEKDPRLLYELDILYEKAQTPLSKRLALFEKNQQITVKRVDALARQVLVYMQAFKYDQAIDLLQKYHFYRWEGGEQVRRYYVDVHLLRGLKYLSSQDYEKALQDFKVAYEYPENLEEGRPEENERFAQIFYYIGLAYDKLDDENQARNFYQKAADERIHNSPYLYYKSRAFGKLREPDSARAFANVLAGFSEAESQIDFFAKFGEKRSVRMQQADQHYLKGLAALARGRVNGAREAFKQALTLHPYHYWSEAQLSQLLEIWVYEGDLSQAPKRTTNDYPLSDQQNEQNWKKYEPMSDEFEGTLLDTEKWWPNNPTWKGRQPAFFYSGNVEVKDGKLHLYMRKNEVPEMPKEEGYHTYTSAAVKSKTTVKYGYFEVKAKPMNSAGSSSFWFYDQADDEWTEIDVYEIGGNSTGFENKYNMNAHVFRTPEEVRHWSVPAKWTAPSKFADDYHVFGLEWDEEKLKWYVDGVLVYWIENTHWHQPLTLNFDSETMPNWFGLPMDNDLPSVYKVEYVRAWKK